MRKAVSRTAEQYVKAQELIAQSDKCFVIGDKNRAIARLCQAAHLNKELHGEEREQIDRMILAMEKKWSLMKRK